ncbi:MAG: hypothetical protein V3T84_01330 [Phycisphaerales bacterium]
MERLRYWQGQMLRSGDLNDQLAIDEEMRRWHNRAIHRAYGIVKGLEVESQIAKGPDRRTTVLVVKPGLAYDGCGGAICLPCEKQVPLPLDWKKVACWTLYIGARGTSREATECCFPTRPMRQQPDLFWRPSDLPRSVDSVPIVALRRTDAVTDDGSGTGTGTPAEIDTEMQVDESVRVMVRPEARPRIAHGATIQGQTAWKEWTISQFIFVKGGDAQPAATPASGHVRAAAIVTQLRKVTSMVGMLPTLVSTNVVAVAQVLTKVSKQTVAKRAELGILRVETVVDTSAAGFSGEPAYFAWLRGHPAVSGACDLPTFTLGRITDSNRNSFTFSALVSADRSASLNFALRHLYVCWMGIECVPPCADSNEVDHGRPC